LHIHLLLALGLVPPVLRANLVKPDLLLDLPVFWRFASEAGRI